MLFVAVALAVLALALGVALVLSRRTLATRQASVDSLQARLTEAEAGRDAAAAQTATVDAARATAESDAAAANAVAVSLRERLDAAEAVAAEAEDARVAAQAEVAETATLAARLIDDGSADPAALWALERLRSERTWRHSVAPVPGEPSPLAEAVDPLAVALGVEADAIREDTGAVVDLEIDLPGPLSPAASLATLRAAQELLALAVQRGEVTTLRVRADGDDVCVAVDAVDVEGTAMAPVSLDLPPSRIEPEPGAVRIRGAAATPG